MQLGDMVVVVFVVWLCFGVGQIGFQLMQVSVVIDGVFDGGMIQCWCFLCDVGYVLVCWEIDIVLVGMQLVVQYGEQVGFVGVIGIDQVDFVVWIECQVDIVQEWFDVVLEGNLLEMDYW